MAPRQILETFSPVLPRLTYSISLAAPRIYLFAVPKIYHNGQNRTHEGENDQFRACVKVSITMRMDLVPKIQSASTFTTSVLVMGGTAMQASWLFRSILA